MSVNAPKIKDIEKKVEIWENPPYHKNKSKLEEMEIDYDANRLDTTIKYSKKIASKEYEDIKELADTFTYLYEIETGYESEKYDDVPYIIPYLVNKGRKSIILLSGGGFCYKTFHGGINGGKKVADILNKHDINVFLLDYRIAPYKFPAAMLDLQRAVRYIKYNASNFDIDKNEISILGYSAGGYIAGSFINKYMGYDFFEEFNSSYKKDEIDIISDEVKSVAFVYPCLTFNYNVPMLFAVADEKSVKNEKKRKKLLDELNLSNKINSVDIKQFVTYSNEDKTVDYRGTEEYVKKLKSKGGNINRIFIANEDHGFDESLFIDEYLRWLEA